MYYEKIDLPILSNLKLVYELKKDLENKPEYVQEVQSVSLDSSKPHIGLKGNKGLYGSQQWWENINSGDIPIKFSYGVITRVYEAGQDHMGIVNSFDYETETGFILTEGIYNLY